MSAQTVSKKFERQTVYAQGNMGQGGSTGAYNPNASMSWGPKIADLANDATYGGNTDNVYTQQYGKHEGMYYNPKYAAAGLDGWTTPQTYDNVGDFFNTGFTQNSNFGISQKNGNLAYSFGIGDTYQKGIIPSTGMMRTTARGAVDFEINKQWKTGFSANYSSTKITSAPGANDSFMSYLYGAPAEFNLRVLLTTSQTLHLIRFFIVLVYSRTLTGGQLIVNIVRQQIVFLVMHTLSSVLISIGTKSVSTLYSASKQVLMYIQRLMMISMSMVLWFLATRQVVA